ncbi:FG-GAP-like repeat-containing protein [Rhodopirellula halodulae]|uniref:FG-GAP-like repeat-containing protein n=1 Tax=Rhodopirellula halodulae TaxID=2894198 RepID=UPI001E5B83FD|nr:FG-GAP-like repeat-containing protein [Rhodopirellula sp. JC737]MCC9655424.1 FG-GAP-like repeat-containing protein [Rhodopirellula sp. JC737]
MKFRDVHPVIVPFLRWPIALLLCVMLGCRESEPKRIVPKVEVKLEESEAAAQPNELLRKAEKAVTQADWKNAKRYLTDLLVVEPSHPAGLFLMARVEAEDGNLENAIEMLSNVSDEDAKFGIAALGQRGEFLRQVGRTHEAIEVWKTLLAKPSVANDPFADQIRDQLISDLQRVGRRIEAGRQLRLMVKRSVATEEHLRSLLYVTQPPKTREAFAKEVELERLRMEGNLPADANQDDADSQSGLNAAWKSLIERRTREAIGLLEEVVKTEPTLQAHALLAYAYSDLQDFDRMRATLLQARRYEESADDLKSFPSFWMAVGAEASYEQNLDEAIHSFATAMKLDPTSDRAHELLASALLLDGKVDLAEAVDERRYLLAGPREAYLAIGPGQPDDLRAGKFLVADLLKLGEVDQACAWRRIIAKRQRGKWGTSDEVRELCRQWQAISEDEILDRQLAGVRPTEFAAVDLAWLESGSIEQLDGKRSGMPNESSYVPPRLVDVAPEVGLDAVFYNRDERVLKLMRLHESLGPGTAALDFDRDGQVDFYVNQASGEAPQSAGTRPNHLFRGLRGEASITYEDVTALAGADDRGYGVGLTVGDWNQDGFDDLVVGNVGRNRLFLNQGDGSFWEASEAIGWTAESFTSSLAMADMDGDALPDLIEINYVTDPRMYEAVETNGLGLPTNLPGPNRFRAALDRLWLGGPRGRVNGVTLRRDAKVNFGEESAKPTSGENDFTDDEESDPLLDHSLPKIGDDAFPGLGVIVGQMDGAPGLECFVANDSRPNQFWKVQRDGNLVQLQQFAETIGLATSSQGKTTACMGVAAADFDRNGYQDLVVTNWYDEWLNLYQQTSPGMYRDVAIAFGLDRFSDRHVGFGTQGIDYDNNGWVDLLIGNGHIEDLTHQLLRFQMETQVLVNLGDRFEQADMESEVGGYWSEPHIGRSMTRCDHNRDGRLDALLSDLHDPLALLENQTESQQHWIQFVLTARDSERLAIGTRVEVRGTPLPSVAELNAGSGYAASNQAIVHLGLAAMEEPVDVQITWPDGTKQQLEGLAVDQRYLVVEGQEVWTDE